MRSIEAVPTPSTCRSATARVGGAGLLFLLVCLLALAPAAIAAQNTLEVGATGTSDPYSATLVSTVQAAEFDGIPGDWLLAEVDVRATTEGINLNAVLDFQIRFPGGGVQFPFPTTELLVDAPKELAAGESARLVLGLNGAGIGVGPAELVYQPFTQTEVAAWRIDIPGSPVAAVPPVEGPGGDLDFITPAPAGSGPEQIISFDAAYEIRPDGVLSVTETIEYDFGVLEKRGIFREIATRQRYSDDKDRRYQFTLLGVEADRGAPSDTQVTQEGDFTRIRIGDPDVTITGPHTYTIRYELAGALNPQATLDELYWNVTGDRWTVAMADVSVRVSAPQGVARVACFAGSVYSTDPCSAATIDEAGVATFADDGLYGGEQLTIVAGIPKGSVTIAPPDLVDPPKTAEDKVTDAVQPGIGDVLGATLVGVAGVGTAAVLVSRRGRDLQAAGSAVEAVHDPTAGPVRRVGLLERVETPVEFEPPDGIRPGLLGTLFDEKADTIDVTATIIDLAVRGYLRIEEIPKEGWFGDGDHRLVKLREPDDLLLTYERRLMNSLFRDSDEGERLLSDMKNTFASELADVQESMYAEVVRRRWFEQRPDKTRNKWGGIGFVVLFAGGGLAVAATIFSYPAWPGAALFLVGLVFMILAGRMPRRTAQGTAVNRRVQGFRRFIVDSEVHRANFAERMNLFTDYLPYAVVFGAVDKWADTFAELNGGQVPVGAWYVGHHPFNASSFGSSMNSFSSAASSSMSSTPGGSGGSGFGGGGGAGGGGGGGGGGSW